MVSSGGQISKKAAWRQTGDVEVWWALPGKDEFSFKIRTTYFDIEEGMANIQHPISKLGRGKDLKKCEVVEGLMTALDTL